MDTVVKRFRGNTNATGSMVFLEGERDIPFPIRRVYYIYGVKGGARRGFHGHKALQQYLIAVSGSCRVLMDDGAQKETVVLNDPAEGLYVGPLVWHEMYDFSEDAVLLVLASGYYDESDYLRDYEAFIQYVKEHGQ